MRYSTKAVLFLLPVALIALAAYFGMERLGHITSGKTRFNLVYTSDVSGRLEPCGCFSGQLGGLTRLSTWFRGNSLDPVLILDLGNAIAGLKDYERHHYRHMLEAFADMDYHALNLGENEARLSAKELVNLAKNSNVPLVCANIVDTSGKSVLTSHVELELRGVKVAVVGVLDEKRVRDKLGKGLEMRPMSLVLGELLPKLRDRVDLLVLMAMTDEAGSKILHERFIEIDVLLAGGVRQPSPDPIRLRQSVRAGLTGDGKNFAIMSGELAGSGAFTVDRYDVILLSQVYAQDKNILSYSEDYRRFIADIELDVDRGTNNDPGNIPGVRPEATYVGSQVCAGCHQNDYLIWSRSGHAHALETLVKREVDKDPSCVRCHSVGFGTPSGFKRLKPEKHLSGVGCESCHGPGSEHVASRLSGKKSVYRMPSLSQNACRKCHYGEFSRPFSWQEFWPRIQHGFGKVEK